MPSAQLLRVKLTGNKVGGPWTTGGR